MSVYKEVQYEAQVMGVAHDPLLGSLNDEVDQHHARRGVSTLENSDRSLVGESCTPPSNRSAPSFRREVAGLEKGRPILE
jgi:hypothetical protein